MLGDITDVFANPEAYVCMWRDGELYVRAATDPAVAPIETELALAS